MYLQNTFKKLLIQFFCLAGFLLVCSVPNVTTAQTTNYSYHESAVLIEDSLNKITTITPRSSPAAPLLNFQNNPSSVVQAQNIQSTLNQIDALLAPATTIEVLVDISNEQVEVQLLDKAENLQRSSFSVQSSVPKNEAAYVNEAVSQAASLYNLDQKPLARGATAVQTFSNDSVFFTKTSTVTSQNTAPQATQPPQTQRSNLHSVKITGSVPGFRAKATLVFGPETVSSKQLSTSTVEYRYNTLKRTYTGVDVSEQAVDLRDQVLDDLQSKIPLNRSKILESTQVSFDLFDSEQEVKDYRNSLSARTNAVENLGVFSIITDVQFSVGDVDGKDEGFGVVVKTDQNESFFAQYDPEDRCKNRNPCFFRNDDYSFQYIYDGTYVVSEREKNVNDWEVRNRLEPLLRGMGKDFGVSDKQFFDDIATFLVDNSRYKNDPKTTISYGGFTSEELAFGCFYKDNELIYDLLDYLYAGLQFDGNIEDVVDINYPVSNEGVLNGCFGNKQFVNLKSTPAYSHLQSN